LLACEQTKDAVLIDPVIEQAERDATLIKDLGLNLKYAMETHVHADHVTGGYKLSKLIPSCKQVFPKQSALTISFPVHRVDDGDKITFGTEELQVLFTPGHTDDSVSFVSAKHKMVFTGDCLFIRGCGRTDFQNGNVELMYQSIMNKLYKLPDDYVVYPGHDYKGMVSSTIDEEKKLNHRIPATQTLEKFKDIMHNLKLATPKMIHLAVPCNQKAGSVPIVEGKCGGDQDIAKDKQESKQGYDN
jgi:sulfur dioxygenase